MSNLSPETLIQDIISDPRNAPGILTLKQRAKSSMIGIDASVIRILLLLIHLRWLVCEREKSLIKHQICQLSLNT